MSIIGKEVYYEIWNIKKMIIFKTNVTCSLKSHYIMLLNYLLKIAIKVTCEHVKAFGFNVKLPLILDKMNY